MKILEMNLCSATGAVSEDVCPRRRKRGSFARGRTSLLAGSAVLVTLLVPQLAWARAISFAEARAEATMVAPDVQLARRRVAISTADVEAAGALTNPTLSLSTARQTARLGTSLALPLPLFGQRSTSVKVARADADAVGLDVEVIQRDARWGATLAWLDLWEAQARAGLLDLAAKDADRVFQIATEKFDAGTGARLDVVRTRAELARAASEADAARFLVTAAAARLAPWIGAAPDDSLTATGGPDYPENPRYAVDTLEHQLAGHPVLKRDRAQVLAATRRIQNEERLRWPTVTPQLTLNEGDPTLPGTDVILGLSFDLPVLSLRAGATARARAQRALAETAAAADQERLLAELLDAYRRTEGASLRLRALRGQVLPAMKEARDMTEEGYRSGKVDLIRVLEAQRALLESHLAEADAAALWARAVADLESASGADLADSGGNHAQ